jgi:hypothetical protein
MRRNFSALAAVAGAGMKALKEMRSRRLLAWSLTIAAALTGEAASAALFSSSTSPVGLSSNVFHVNTFLRRPDNGGNLSIKNTHGVVKAGSTNVAMTVDTVADTVHYDDVDFIAATLTPQMRESEAAFIDETIVVTPANFPLPAVTEQVTGNYFARLTINSLTTSAAPTFVSSQTRPITANPTDFSADASLTLTLPSITIAGVYEAVGPSTTVSQAFTIVYNSTSVQKVAQSTIPGGPGFGNGFPFNLETLLVDYHAASPIIFNQIVDDIRFTAFADSLVIDYFGTQNIPEPSSLGLAIAAAISGAVTLRKRRMGVAV